MRRGHHDFVRENFHGEIQTTNEVYSRTYANTKQDCNHGSIGIFNRFFGGSEKDCRQSSNERRAGKERWNGGAFAGSQRRENSVKSDEPSRRRARDSRA